jgi:hypothetical protein
MTQDEIIGIVNKASKEWLKEFPSPEETANQVPKRFLEIFAKLVADKEREKWSEVEAYLIAASEGSMSRNNSEALAGELLTAIRARGQA